jgi:glutathione S-transferase
LAGVSTPVLWHIQISHYNEKARWALDHKRVAHERRAPLPGVVHPLVALAKTRRPTFPVLDLDGRSIGDSTRIIEALERRWPEPPLYPADPVERRRALELEQFFDEEIGPHPRRLVFYETSRDPEASAHALDGLPVPGPMRAAGGTIVRVLARRYGGRAETMELARERVRLGYERILAELQPSGYLVGDSFSVADLTAASILMHPARPAELQYPIPPYPRTVADFFATLPREGLDWVRRMWREHRPPSAAVSG